METLPLYISILFIATVAATVFFLYKASRHSTLTLLIVLAWTILQCIIGWSGFYLVTNTLPPRFLLLVAPPILLIVFLFITRDGKSFINKLDARMLTLLHVVRIPVEVILFLLFVHKTIPAVMTFGGKNLDILAGISAPFIFYFGYAKPTVSRTAILLWNFVCLGLLLNIVVHAVLSAPSPFQQFAFDQPNIAVLHFPFVLLPGCIVPIVFFSHLVCIRQLLNKASF